MDRGEYITNLLSRVLASENVQIRVCTCVKITPTSVHYIYIETPTPSHLLYYTIVV
jgi:hypothetical protein